MLTKIPSRRFSIAGLCGCVGLIAMLSGCDTVTTGAKIEARIQEMPELFAQLPKEAQKDIRWGYIKKGFNPAMVYMALGSPSKRESSEDKTKVTWTYYDDTVISQEVAMRSGAAENGTAYYTGGITKPGSTPFVLGQTPTSKQVADSGVRGPSGSGLDYFEVGDHAARVLVIFDQGRVMTVHRIEATPREETFEDKLR